MNTNWKNRIPLAIIAILLVAVVVLLFRAQPSQAAKEGDAAGVSPRYTVVETEGHNLIVTDNKTQIVYFYTIDKDKDIGSELKLRGTIDLKKVGQKEIKPTKTAK